MTLEKKAGNLAGAGSSDEVAGDAALTQALGIGAAATVRTHAVALGRGDTTGLVRQNGSIELGPELRKLHSKQAGGAKAGSGGFLVSAMQDTADDMDLTLPDQRHSSYES